MHAIVLFHSPWQPTKDLALSVATVLGCRAIAFERRPDLEMYQLVVLAAPAASMLDPRLLAFAGMELRGKTVAFLSDAGILGDPLFWGLSTAAALGGCRVFSPSLHASTGWLADTNARAIGEAQAWAKSLAVAFPPRQFPEGTAGKRVMS
jgi:hypothetical protein